MNTLQKINKAKYEVAEEILSDIWDIVSSQEWSWEDEWDIERLHNQISEYIETQHLFKSDYTK
jgi:hypothetical protein